MKVVTIKKGKHAPGINFLGLFPIRLGRLKKIEIEFRFSEESKYLLPGVDQQDWNKLGGLVFNPFKRSKDTILGGWRYNPLTGLFSVTAYQNDKYKQNSGYGSGQALAHYEPGQRGKIEIRKSGKDYYYRFFKVVESEWKELQAIEVKKTIRKGFFFAFKSGVWFGGNNAAPNKIKFEHEIKYK